MIITGKITVKHRGYTMEFARQENEETWYGHILHIKDLITAQTENGLTIAYEARDAINDYIDTCKELGVEPNKPGGESE